MIPSREGQKPTPHALTILTKRRVVFTLRSKRGARGRKPKRNTQKPNTTQASLILPEAPLACLQNILTPIMQMKDTIYMMMRLRVTEEHARVWYDLFLEELK